MARRYEDLTGQRFHKLTVLELDPNPPRRWRCLCDCGGIVVTTGSKLASGHTKSCGCLRKTNQFLVHDNHAEIILTGKHNGVVGLIDLEDLDRCKQHNWFVDGKGYLKAKIKGRGVLLHRFVMTAKGGDLEGITIDHINGNGYDNRKSNLRPTNKAQNAWNRKVSSVSSSGVTGVFPLPNGTWRATIMCNGKTIHLGCFADFDVACRVRKEAEIEYHGEYRNQREE